MTTALPPGPALVVGYGRSGRALAAYLTARRVPVRVVDRDPGLSAPPPIANLEARFGAYGAEALEGCRSVYLSPGVAWDSEIAVEARRRRLAVSSEVDLFLKLCPAPVVGITGTNGKTTTTAMVGSVLASGPRPVIVGGNIGEPLLARLEEITAEHWVVLELSSYQLESCERPHPRIGVVLNVTPDHLARHGSVERYADAKARLIEFLDEDDDAVLNGLDPVCRQFASRTKARVTWFDGHQPVPSLRLRGGHNLSNALAAATVGRIAGLADHQVAAALAGFSGVEHRLELVGEAGRVSWYNDSKATNPDSSLAALASFPGERVVLIAGGQAAEFDLGPWLKAVRERTEAAVLIGESAVQVAEGLRGHPVRLARDLRQAVEIARGLAEPRGVVLFSPGFKSFDMFSDFEDRGRRFKAAVMEFAG